MTRMIRTATFLAACLAAEPATAQIPARADSQMTAGQRTPFAAAATVPTLTDTVPEAISDYGTATAPNHLLLRGALDIATFGPVIADFVAAHPDFSVTIEQWNTLQLFDRVSADCAAGITDADLVISSAVDLQVKLVNEGCAQPYISASTRAMDPDRNWRDELFGVTQEPAVMVYNRDALAPQDRPLSRFDLLDLLRRPGTPLMGGKVATYDIRASGVGYLFAFVDARQASTFGSLIEAFGRVGAVTTCCSAEIIDGVITGRYVLAYNVLGSYALQLAADHPQLAIVAPSDYTLILSRAVMIPRHQGRSPLAAGLLIDYLLSGPGRASLSRNHHYVSIGAGQDVGFPDDSAVALRAIPLSPVLLLDLDRQQRRRFLAAWAAAFGLTQTD